MANLLGSLCIAWLLSQSGLWHSGANLAGGMTIKLAVGKVTLTFGQAVVLGILCNWLVCLAVWLSFSTTSTAGKILAIYLPIFMFIVSGFEHSVANMYYIPAVFWRLPIRLMWHRPRHWGLHRMLWHNLVGGLSLLTISCRSA
ncbi:formate/nitrite transporter family protein [Veillonella sp.]|uniref:formate/nitrite transporter family protein n=1 Tax=Veillonella sp. TaxID=1926307 RepID=UPI0034305FE4